TTHHTGSGSTSASLVVQVVVNTHQSRPPLSDAASAARRAAEPEDASLEGLGNAEVQVVNDPCESVFTATTPESVSGLPSASVVDMGGAHVLPSGQPGSGADSVVASEEVTDDD